MSTNSADYVLQTRRYLKIPVKVLGALAGISTTRLNAWERQQGQISFEEERRLLALVQRLQLLLLSVPFGLERGNAGSLRTALFEFERPEGVLHVYAAGAVPPARQ